MWSFLRRGQRDAGPPPQAPPVVAGRASGAKGERVVGNDHAPFEREVEWNVPPKKRIKKPRAVLDRADLHRKTR